MNRNGRLRYAMIGAGAIAQTYAQSFQQCRTGRLVAVADVRREAADAIAQSLGCAGFASYAQMLDDVACDAVVVCTPPASHPEISIHCLDRGAAVLCEKPLAIDAHSARRMFDAAASRERLLTMASKFRFVEDVVRAKALVASGIIGDVVLFENTFTARVDMSSRWNSKPDQSGGGVLIDNGTHSMDLMRYFFGPLADLRAVELKRVQGLAVEDTVRIFARTEGGVTGSIDLSWTINKEQPHYLCIYGSVGTILVGWKESKYRRTKDADWTVFGHGYDKLQAFRRQIDNFSRAIRGEEPPLVTPQDAMASVEAVEAGYEALRQSHWHPVQPSHGNGRRVAAGAIAGNGGHP
jgi:predicted dehydrogenase